MNEVRIPYKPRIVTMLLATLFFVGCAAILAYAAYSNDRGVSFFGIVTFSRYVASGFYWVLSGMSVLFVFGGIWGMYKGVVSRQELVLTDTGITAPRSGVSGEVMSIRYVDVDYLEMQDVQKEQLLKIFAKDGRKLVIARSLLPGKKVFDQVVATVTKNVGAYVA